MTTGIKSPFIPRYGMGSISPNGEITFQMSFVRHDNNADKVDDFIDILTEQDLYKTGNNEIEIHKGMAPKLYSAFLEHSGTLDFIKWMEDNDDGGCFIIVMVENAVTMTKIQAALTADLEANKVLPIV